MRKSKKLIQGQNDNEKKAKVEVHDIKIPVEFGGSFISNDVGSEIGCDCVVMPCDCDSPYVPMCSEWCGRHR